MRNEKEIEIQVKPKRKKNPEQSTNDFFAQYKDPRWQKKRLKIMERDGFSCTSCDCKDETLNVHHAVPYRKNTRPWEYEDDELTTLCENCHKELTEIIDSCKLIIMGRCWCKDSAGEMLKIMERIDGMNPFQLVKVWQMLDILNKK